MSFNIEDYVTFDSKGRAICPSCQQLKGSSFRKRNLSILGSGAYKCFAGCDPKDIRNALGAAKPSIVPTAIARQTSAPKSVTVSPEKVAEAHQQLINSNGPAKQWLRDRGINDELMKRHQLGITRAKCGNKHLPAITIPLPNADGTAYYQKKRLAPWLPESERPEEYKPWSQAGIPVRHFFTYKPLNPEQTWLCEGEWDAIVLGQVCREAAANVAVGTFTCGAGVVPPQEQLDELPGEVVTFYDRNDKPVPNGDRPGEVGARKIVSALGSRGRVGLVPMPDDCSVTGWDVTNAIQHGYQFADFVAAAAAAGQLDGDQPKQKDNPLRARLMTNAQLLELAPDYVEWLVPDLLPANELIMIAAPPRAGKSLLCMTLAKCVASGENFLDRPVTQGGVLYVRCEDALVKIKQRELAQGWDENLPVYWLDRFKLSQVEHLRELAEELDVRLIVLDTLSRIRDDSVTESSAEMSRVLEPLQELAEELGVCIALVHHTNKINVENAGSLDIFDTIRGSSAIRATCRGTLVLAADQQCYRLCAENGYGKVDLRIRLDGTTAEWKLLGRWQEQISSDQRSIVEDYLNKVGQATLEQIFEDTQISKASLYKVLSRLVKDGYISKSGHRRQVLYTRSSDLIGLSGELSDDGNSHPDDDRDTYLTKNSFPSVGDHPESDQTGTCDTLITFPEMITPDKRDKLSDRGSNPDSVRVSSSDKSSDKPHLSGEGSNCQIKFAKGDEVEIYLDGEWVSAVYKWTTRRSRISTLTGKLAEGHRVEVNGEPLTISEHDLRQCGGEIDG